MTDTPKGRFRGLVGYVWWCGDYECDCTQAVIEAVWLNAVDPRWSVREVVWSGLFRTDGEAGAKDELMGVRAAMAVRWPEAETAIAWR